MIFKVDPMQKTKNGNVYPPKPDHYPRMHPPLLNQTSPYALNMRSVPYQVFPHDKTPCPNVWFLIWWCVRHTDPRSVNELVLGNLPALSQKEHFEDMLQNPLFSISWWWLDTTNRNSYKGENIWSKLPATQQKATANRGGNPTARVKDMLQKKFRLLIFP